MASAEREQLKERLQASLAGRFKGLELDTPFHWVTDEVKDPAAFFEKLPRLLPSDCVLCAEGTSIASDIAQFYGRHRSRSPMELTRDTIFPVSEMFHFNFSPGVCGELKLLAATRRQNELFDHIKAYAGDKLLLHFHDAFSGWLRFSEHLLEPTVRDFCCGLGVRYERKKTKQSDPEGARWLLDLMENPEKFRKVRIAGEPWWKRIWRRRS